MQLEMHLENCSGVSFVPPEEDFRRWAGAALSEHDTDAELGIRIVDEEESQALNRQYRGKDKPTNVLSFPAELPDGIDHPLLGDLVICAPVMSREADEQGKDSAAHWAHLVIHGVLHLLGYDHQQDAAAHDMERLEIQILAGLGYPDPYAYGTGG
ncbi:MAG: rRNA maturation RNase YbeY [Gammaproteobacteria bacterium]